MLMHHATMVRIYSEIPEIKTFLEDHIDCVWP